MATNIVFNGTTYSIPAEGDTYGDTLSSYLIAIASATLQKSGGSFALTNELNFGASYGLKLAYAKSQATNPASAGVLRLGNTDSISFRNAANNSDLSLNLSSDSIQFNSIHLVDVSSTQTLTNKTLTSPVINSPTGIVKADVGLSNVDNTSDATKNSDTATLTNKTISGLSNTFSDLAYGSLVLTGSIVDADISASASIAYSKLNLGSSIVNADVSASAAIEVSKLETLTAEKMVVTDPSGKLTTIAVSAIKAGYLSGVTSDIQAQLDSKALASDLSTHESDTSAHGVSGNVVGTSDTQVLTNKDIDGGTASNTNRVTLPKNTKTNLDALTRKEGTIVYDTTSKKSYLDNGTSLIPVGSGSGNVNFISNPDGSLGITDWAEGSYSAAKTPTGSFTASSGAGAFAISTTTTNPLGNGTTSFTLTKTTGASRQGRAVETSFALPLSYRGKVLQLDIDYIILSGGFVAKTASDNSSMIWYCSFSTDNGSTYTVSEPSSISLLSSSTTIADVFKANIQTPHDATHMKLIAYVSETASTAWEVKTIVKVSPSTYVYGTPVTDLINTYSATITGMTVAGSVTYTSNTLSWQRIADQIRVTGNIRLNTVTTSPTGVPYINLPSGLSLDSTKYSDAGRGAFGASVAKINGVAVPINWVAQGPNSQTIAFQNGVATPGPFLAGDEIKVDFIAPIQGWSSSVQMSDSTDTRVIVLKATATGQTPAAVNATTAFTLTANRDTHGAFGTTTYIIPSAGYYRMSWVADSGLVTSGSANQVMQAFIIKNGTALFSGANRSQAATTLNNFQVIAEGVDLFAQGDAITVNVNTNFTTPGTTASGVLSIEKVSGPSAIAATETVACRYTGTTGATVSTSAATVVFNTKDYDTHGIYNSSTGVATIPLAGKYRIGAEWLFLLNSTVGSGVHCSIYKNGSQLVRIKSQNAWAASVSVQVAVQGWATLNLVAGDTIEIRAFRDVNTAANAIDTNTLLNYLNIEKVGN